MYIKLYLVFTDKAYNQIKVKKVTQCTEENSARSSGWCDRQADIILHVTRDKSFRF